LIYVDVFFFFGFTLIYERLIRTLLFLFPRSAHVYVILFYDRRTKKRVFIVQSIIAVGIPPTPLIIAARRIIYVIWCLVCLRRSIFFLIFFFSRNVLYCVYYNICKYWQCPNIKKVHWVYVRAYRCEAALKS